MNDMIPLMVPSMPQAAELLPYLKRIDAAQWYTNFGPLSRELEQRWVAEVTDDKALFAVSVANGCIGLELALSALGLPAGSRVLLPSLTFVATGTAVIRAGLVPVFCDVCPDRWILTPEIARSVIADLRADAVMPVATFGHPQDVAQWAAFSRDTGLPVLIDAAGAFGNQRAEAGCHVLYSLHATKALGAGEGGVLVTADHKLAARVRRLSNFGLDTATSEVGQVGTNGKLSEYHAAVALASLDSWPFRYRALQRLMLDYREKLGALPVLLQSFDPSWVSPVLPIALSSKEVRDSLMKGLAADGIETRRWYCPPLHRQPAFESSLRMSCPVTDALADSLLGLPFHLFIDAEQQQRLFAALSIQLLSEASEWHS